MRLGPPSAKTQGSVFITIYSLGGVMRSAPVRLKCGHTRGAFHPERKIRNKEMLFCSECQSTQQVMSLKTRRRAMLIDVRTKKGEYQSLAFCCPGCEELSGSGLHLLPVNTTVTSPSWSFDGDLDSPTVNPSILTYKDRPEKRCHSWLHGGVFHFLSDSAHSMKDSYIPLPDLPDWFHSERES